MFIRANREQGLMGLNGGHTDSKGTGSISRASAVVSFSGAVRISWDAVNKNAGGNGTGNIVNAEACKQKWRQEWDGNCQVGRCGTADIPTPNEIIQESGLENVASRKADRKC